MTVTTDAPTREQTVTDATSEAPATNAGITATIRDKLGQHGGELKDQALNKAREYATQGKEKATDVLDSVAKLVENTANTLDDKLGSAGSYAHSAADALTEFAEQLRNKDFEALFEDAKQAVRRNPVIAVGAAAAVGFMLVRMLRSGSDAPTGNAPSADDITA